MVYELHHNSFRDSASFHLRNKAHTEAVECKVAQVQFVEQVTPKKTLSRLYEIGVIAPLQSFFFPLYYFFAKLWVQGRHPVSIPFTMEANRVVDQVDVIDQMDVSFRNAHTLMSSYFKRTFEKLSIDSSFFDSFLNFLFNQMEFSRRYFLLWFRFGFLDAKVRRWIFCAKASFDCLFHYNAQKKEFFSSGIDVDLLLSPLNKLKAQIPVDVDRVENIVLIKKGQEQSIVVEALLMCAGIGDVTRMDIIQNPVFKVSVVTDYSSLFFKQFKLELQHFGFVLPIWVIGSDFSGLIDVLTSDTIFPSRPEVGRPFSFVYRSHNSVSHGVTNQLRSELSVTQCHRKFRHFQTLSNKTSHNQTFSNHKKRQNGFRETIDCVVRCLGVCGFVDVSQNLTHVLQFFIRAFGFAGTALQRASLGLWGSGWPLSDRWRPSFSFSCLSLEISGIGIKWARGFAACFGPGSFGSAWLQRRACA